MFLLRHGRKNGERATARAIARYRVDQVTG